MYEFFIAKRYLKSKHKINFITIISLLSTLGITIGVAALIVVISVFNGFGSLVTSMLVNFDPHLTISSNNQQIPIEEKLVSNLLSDQKNISAYYPFAEGNAVLINNSQYQPIKLKGINHNDGSEIWGVAPAIVKGKMNNPYPEDIDEIVLGQRMALKISANVGDTLYIASFNDLEKMAVNFYSVPRIRKVIVSGIFVSNNKDYDIQYVFTSLESAQKIFGFGDNISGIEMRLHNINSSDNLKSYLKSHLPENTYDIKTWYDLHQDLYSVMLIERWAAFILLTLIISVATFNILGSLTMSVIEKKKDIAVLRSMGVSKKSLVRIFTFEGMLIGIIGTTCGLILGLFLCYMQIEFKIYPLDPAKYIIDAIPVQIRFSDLITISAASMMLSFFASIYPAKRAGRTNITEAIKYE